MARKKSGIAQARGFLHALARLLGDLQAVRKGPEAVAKRAARRAAGKLAGGFGNTFGTPWVFHRIPRHIWARALWNTRNTFV